MTTIPGYRLNDPALPPSPVSPQDFEELKASLLFGPDDVAALRRAHDVLAPQVEAILDVWYGFVGSNPHLLRYFSTETGEPVGPYLDAVRKRFGQWILDTCRADYDAAWLAWQDEIGRRHHRIGKNKTDGVSAAPHIPMSQLLALAIPISVTVRPFLAKSGNSADDVDAMHAAWTKSVWLQAILWARPYANAGDF
ncbi:MAG TPA: protoglobin domain-containing protein [Hyphomonas sp.]|nr:protogloblin ApPgb [Hyphomonas sp.]HRJ01043.1 protoglobin domain-containing protein [Hyphomonas sp.]HRK66672.1 protoglobin domain-containing protein [Hyphomonas sp.]